MVPGVTKLCDPLYVKVSSESPVVIHVRSGAYILYTKCQMYYSVYEGKRDRQLGECASFPKVLTPFMGDWSRL